MPSLPRPAPQTILSCLIVGGCSIALFLVYLSR